MAGACVGIYSEIIGAKVGTLNRIDNVDNPDWISSHEPDNNGSEEDDFTIRLALCGQFWSCDFTSSVGHDCLKTANGYH
ncbi:hypothetical protein Bca4012_034205 [Brassica carinata]